MVDPDELVRMSFWYPKLKEFTMASESFRVDDGLRNELSSLFDSAGVRDPFKLARKFLREHRELRKFLVGGIRRWGGVFVRGDRVSPKDACLDFSYLFRNPFKYGLAPLPNTSHNACIALTPESALALLISSDRVGDLDDLRFIWVREPRILRNEFRVFVKDSTPRLVSWYYPEVPSVDHGFPILLFTSYVGRIIKAVSSRLGLRDYAVDIALMGKETTLIELTPSPQRDRPYITDPIMFRKDFWVKLDEAVRKDTTIARYTPDEDIFPEGDEI